MLFSSEVPEQRVLAGLAYVPYAEEEEGRNLRLICV